MDYLEVFPGICGTKGEPDLLDGDVFVVPVPAGLLILLGALSPLGLAVLIIPLLVPCQLALLRYKTLTLS